MDQNTPNTVITRWLGVALVVVLASCGDGGRDWKDEADRARTCQQATQLVVEYVESPDDNGLRGSGTHGYLADTAAMLCG